MFEIELKARVLNRELTISNLNSFGCYKGSTVKDDTYYYFDLPSKEQSDSKPHISCRLRHEVHTNPDSSKTQNGFFTYKSKEKRLDGENRGIEVNVERETAVSDPAPIHDLLLATGYYIGLTKHKDVEEWTYNPIEGSEVQAHIELCTVPPLGDFLEIEIVAETKDNLEHYKILLKEILSMAGIDQSQIEDRYYSELLALAKADNK